MKSNEGVGAASATYRKATKAIAKKIRVKVKHTRYPCDDFDLITKKITVFTNNTALKWYRAGVRRGFIAASDRILSGQLKLKNGKLYCSKHVVISVRTRFPGAKWEKRKLVYSASELEFE